MSKVIPLAAGDGDVVYFEIEEDFVTVAAAGDGEVAGLKPAEALARLEALGTNVGEICSTLYERAQAAIGEHRPDTLTFEFGVKLGGEAGIPFVTRGSAEAALKVIATWSAPDA